MNITLRHEEACDAAAIAKVTAAAFLHATHTNHEEQFIAAALRKAGKLAISIVAEHGGAVVGHVAVSPVTISDGSARWYGLGPVAVAPDWQGRGIGSRLVEQALCALQQTGAAGCVLVGDPDYYDRFGFTRAAGLLIPDVAPEYVLSLVFSDKKPAGTVAFHESFYGPD
ncbi:MAG: N-acetyltransferase [Deltaproteobacteria bacterium]|nr:N-acetyltransferase [Deltaproteobacteria bacterium]